jgi:hypothetical protein
MVVVGRAQGSGGIKRASKGESLVKQGGVKVEKQGGGGGGRGTGVTVAVEAKGEGLGDLKSAQRGDWVLSPSEGFLCSTYENLEVAESRSSVKVVHCHALSCTDSGYIPHMSLVGESPDAKLWLSGFLGYHNLRINCYV